MEESLNLKVCPGKMEVVTKGTWEKIWRNMEGVASTVYYLVSSREAGRQLEREPPGVRTVSVD